MYLLENIFSVYLLRTTPMEMAQHDRTGSWKIMAGNCVWRENIPLHLGSPRRHYYIFKTTSQHSSMPPEHITVSNITANIFLNHSMTLWLQEHNLCVTGIYRLLKTMRTAPSWLSQPVQGNDKICRARSQLLLLTLSPLSCLTRWWMKSR